MQDYFDEVIASYGQPAGEPLSPTTIDKLRGKVPNGLIRCWEKYGLGTVLDGFFQFVDPTRYSGVCEAVFDGDPELDSTRSYIIGLSAFGNLLVWNEEYNVISIDLVNLRTFGSSRKKNQEPDEKNLALIGGLAVVDRPSFDERDSNGEGLFKPAMQKLGRLKLNQIYGFVPMLALGGNRSIDRLKIVSAPEHLLILAQIGPVSLLDSSTPYGHKLRDIGG